eukprot:GHVN01080605.1.p1 GENE.GHVN01080605.1~~GHVN01080605.1.p1  ORF type:complete len:646 (-),score=160.23 GHVN01080605.1:185-2071(-)
MRKMKLTADGQKPILPPLISAFLVNRDENVEAYHSISSSGVVAHSLHVTHPPHSPHSPHLPGPHSRFHHLSHLTPRSQLPSRDSLVSPGTAYSRTSPHSLHSPPSVHSPDSTSRSLLHHRRPLWCESAMRWVKVKVRDMGVGLSQCGMKVKQSVSVGRFKFSIRRLSQLCGGVCLVFFIYIFFFVSFRSSDLQDEMPETKLSLLKLESPFVKMHKIKLKADGQKPILPPLISAFVVNRDKNVDAYRSISSSASQTFGRTFQRVPYVNPNNINQFLSELGVSDGFDLEYHINKICRNHLTPENPATAADLAWTLTHLKALHTAYSHGLATALILEESTSFILLPYHAEFASPIFKLVSWPTIESAKSLQKHLPTWDMIRLAASPQSPLDKHIYQQWRLDPHADLYPVPLSRYPSSTLANLFSRRGMESFMKLFLISPLSALDPDQARFNVSSPAFRCKFADLLTSSIKESYLAMPPLFTTVLNTQSHGDDEANEVFDWDEVSEVREVGEVSEASEADEVSKLRRASEVSELKRASEVRELFLGNVDKQVSEVSGVSLSQRRENDFLFSLRWVLEALEVKGFVAMSYTEPPGVRFRPIDPLCATPSACSLGKDQNPVWLPLKRTQYANTT